MPIYRVTVRGADKSRLVRADSAAQARNHVVDVEPLNAEEMADELEKGAAIERAYVPPSPPESGEKSPPPPEAEPKAESTEKPAK